MCCKEKVDELTAPSVQLYERTNVSAYKESHEQEHIEDIGQKIGSLCRTCRIAVAEQTQTNNEKEESQEESAYDDNDDTAGGRIAAFLIACFHKKEPEDDRRSLSQLLFEAK